MLVHFYWIERNSDHIERLFDAVDTSRLPRFNWAAMSAFAAGILATWLFMYGALPGFKGPIAIALGGVDLSWLAGGTVSAGLYAILGPRVYRRYMSVGAPSQTAPSRSADASPATTTGV